MDDLKFNFVIFGSNDDFYRAAYHGIMNLDTVRYIGSPMQCKNRLIRFVHRIHISPKTNKYLSLPFKSIYSCLYFKNDFRTKLPICFLFFGYSRGKVLDWGYYKYVKRKYPKAKLVCFFQDLVSTNANFDFDKFRCYFDLILSFDQEDAKKYGLIYYPLVYSNESPFKPSGDYPHSDIFFAGKAKDRMKEIISAYEKLNGSGLICDFHIVDSQQEYRPYSEQINYCSFLPYEEYLSRLKASSCILELMQHGGHGYTLRTNEAIVYGKKLLSNNSELLNAPFYNDSFIHVFSNPEDIDISFIKNGTDRINYKYTEQISPLSLLEFIQSRLST